MAGQRRLRQIVAKLVCADLQSLELGPLPLEAVVQYVPVRGWAC